MVNVENAVSVVENAASVVDNGASAGLVADSASEAVLVNAVGSDNVVVRKAPA